MKVGIIWGVPRSGTSWLGYLVSRHPDVEYRFQPIHANTFNPRVEIDSTRLDVYFFYARLLAAGDSYLLDGLAKDVTREKKPLLSRLLAKALVFKETHDLNSIQRIVNLDSHSRLLVLIRDPIDVIESWINAPKEFNPEWRVEEEWMWARKKNSEYLGNHFGLNEWIKTTKQVVELSEKLPQQVRIIRYGQLRKSTEETMREVCAHFGIPSERLTFAAPASASPKSLLDEYSVSRPRKRHSSWRHLSNDSKLEIGKLVRAAGLGNFLFRQQE